MALANYDDVHDASLTYETTDEMGFLRSQYLQLHLEYYILSVKPRKYTTSVSNTP